MEVRGGIIFLGVGIIVIFKGHNIGARSHLYIVTELLFNSPL